VKAWITDYQGPDSSRNMVILNKSNAYSESFGGTKNMNQIRHILTDKRDIQTKQWSVQLRSYGEKKKLRDSSSLASNVKQKTKGRSRPSQSMNQQ